MCDLFFFFCSRFIQQLDKDNTGTLDWEEFQQLARKSEESKGEDGQLLKNASETENELQVILVKKQNSNQIGSCMYLLTGISLQVKCLRKAILYDLSTAPAAR